MYSPPASRTQRLVRTLALGLALASAACASAVGTGPRDGAVDASAAMDAAVGCTLPNGSVCAFGSTCPAGDGCNQCTCSSSGAVACTEIACARTCTSSSPCTPGEQCLGSAGCGGTWTCTPVTGCLTVETTYCGCDGVTFISPSSCADRPYAHTGPCETPIADAGTCAAEGSSCTQGPECCSGYCVMMGAINGRCTAVPAGMVGCNGTLCDAATQYCEITYSDTPLPDSANCRPIPAACNGALRCGCVPTGACVCRSASGSTAVLGCPGG